MDVLILGGFGFIGSHVVEALVERGDRVRVLARPGQLPRYRAERTRFDVKLFEGDFCHPEVLGAAVDGVEVIVHLIATALPQTSNEDPAYDVSSNVVGTLRMLELARERTVRRIVFSSSGGTVYGRPRQIPISEQHPTNPICSYGITKLTIEKYLSLYHDLYGLEYVVLRPANAYGEGQDASRQQGAVAAFLAHVQAGKPIVIWGDGSVVRDYVYVKDVARACALATEARVQSAVFNIGTGQGTSLRELVEMIGQVTDVTPDVTYAPGRPVDVPVNILDASLAKQEMGWEPRVTLAEGLRRTWAFIQ